MTEAPPPYDRLAAGELPPAEAEALRKRIDRDPEARARYAEALEVERLLRAEPLLPLPLPLVGRILAATSSPAPVRPHILLARVAACVLVFFASWVAVAGELPTPGDVVAPHPRLVASLDESGLPASPSVPQVIAAARPETASAPLETLTLTLLGLLLLVGGVTFALWSHLAAASGKSASAEAP